MLLLSDELLVLILLYILALVTLSTIKSETDDSNLTFVVDALNDDDDRNRRLLVISNLCGSPEPKMVMMLILND